MLNLLILLKESAPFNLFYLFDEITAVTPGILPSTLWAMLCMFIIAPGDLASQ
jgi:hypothetical protein